MTKGIVAMLMMQAASLQSLKISGNSKDKRKSFLWLYCLYSLTHWTLLIFIMQPVFSYAFDRNDEPAFYNTCTRNHNLLFNIILFALFASKEIFCISKGRRSQSILIQCLVYSHMPSRIPWFLLYNETTHLSARNICFVKGRFPNDQQKVRPP